MTLKAQRSLWYSAPALGSSVLAASWIMMCPMCFLFARQNASKCGNISQRSKQPGATYIYAGEIKSYYVRSTPPHLPATRLIQTRTGVRCLSHSSTSIKHHAGKKRRDHSSMSSSTPQEKLSYRTRRHKITQPLGRLCRARLLRAKRHVFGANNCCR